MIAYKRAALQSNDAFQDVILQNLEREFEVSIKAKDFVDALNVAEELVYSDRSTGLTRKSQVLREQGRLAEALNDVAEALSLSDLTPDQKAQALRNRGATYSQLGESEKEIADYSAVIEMAEAPVDQKAMALVYRGITYARLRESEQAIADYSTVIEMAEAPVDLKVEASIGRGICFRQLGEFERGIADCSIVIEMTDAPNNAKARAMNQRGIIYCNSNQFDAALNEFTSVVKMTGVSSLTRTFALFCIPEAMISTKPLKEAVAGVQRAFEEGDSEVSEYGAYSRYILKMIFGREHASWPEFVEKLVPIYAQYGALSKLGSGLTESIAVLDAGGFSSSRLDLWNSAWKQFGEEYDELSIPLATLEASIQVIKSGNDRPLFGLPLEIRKIVQPLLKNTLSEH